MTDGLHRCCCTTILRDFKFQFKFSSFQFVCRFGADTLCHHCHTVLLIFVYSIMASFTAAIRAIGQDDHIHSPPIGLAARLPEDHKVEKRPTLHPDGQNPGQHYTIEAAGHIGADQLTWADQLEFFQAKEDAYQVPTFPPFCLLSLTTQNGRRLCLCKLELSILRWSMMAS